MDSDLTAHSPRPYFPCTTTVYIAKALSGKLLLFHFAQMIFHRDLTGQGRNMEQGLFKLQPDVHSTATRVRAQDSVQDASDHCRHCCFSTRMDGLYGTNSSVSSEEESGQSSCRTEKESLFLRRMFSRVFDDASNRFVPSLVLSSRCSDCWKSHHTLKKRRGRPDLLLENNHSLNVDLEGFIFNKPTPFTSACSRGTG